MEWELWAACQALCRCQEALAEQVVQAVLVALAVLVACQAAWVALVPLE